MYIVYNVMHDLYLFEDIDQARAFRRTMNGDTSVTWYIAEATPNYGCDRGSEIRARGINKAKFPR